MNFLKLMRMVQAVADPSLSSSSLSKLSQSLRRELADNLILGDSEQLAKLIQRIEQQDDVLAKVLSRHAADFNYLPILSALETLDSHNKEAKS